MDIKTVALTVLGLILSYLSFAQNSIDTANVLFKAKLLTTSVYGYDDKQRILDEIQNQEAAFLDSPSPELSLIRIRFNQKYINGSKGYFIDVNGECDYYVAYINERSRFYRLRGFDVLDLDDFFSAIFDLRINLISHEVAKDSPVDFDCLRDYHYTKPKKRFKIVFDCIRSCNESNPPDWDS